MSEPGGFRVGAARTRGGWKRWTGAVRLGLAVLACAFAGESTAAQYDDLDSAINTLVRELVDKTELRGKKVFVGADDFYEEVTELRLPLSSILLRKCQVELANNRVRSALLESEAVGVLHGRWRRQGKYLHLTLFIASPLDEGEPIALASRDGLVPLDEDIERDIKPTLRAWGRAVVKQLERGEGVRGRGSLAVQLEPFAVENEKLARRLDNWLGKALAGSDKFQVVEPSVSPEEPVQSKGRLRSEVDIHDEYVEVALRVVVNRRRVGFASATLAKTLFPKGVFVDVTARLEECAGHVEAGRLSEARGCYERLEAAAPGDARVREAVRIGLACVKEKEVIVIDPDKDAAKREEDALKLKLAARKDVQRGLSSLDLEVGPIDGLFGSHTRKALRAWQSDRGVGETGYLTEQQAEALIALGREAEKRAEEEARRERKEKARRELVAQAVSEALAGAEEALNREELRKAKGHVEELRRLAGGHPRLGELEARIEELEKFEKRYPPGKRFRDCPACPEMVVVPPGEFKMGSPESEAGRYDDEGPVHGVRIGRPFAVGVYEVTFVEWDACVSGGGCGGYRPDDLGWGRGNRPVMNVSWDDARAYVGWLSEETGEEYRLLSESEWEYVARGGTRTPFHTGETISTGQANYDGTYTYGSGRKGWYRRKTVAVGSFEANGYGLYDLHGNVREWAEDCWNGSYRGAPADGSAWETGNCSRRVLRGGSWINRPRLLRSANRSRFGTGVRDDDNGFRIARTLTP